MWGSPQLCVDSDKTYVSKVMTRNTFHGDPRPSLWRWRTRADRSHVYKFDRTPKSENKQVTQYATGSKLRSVVHANSRNILVADFTQISLTDLCTLSSHLFLLPRS